MGKKKNNKPNGFTEFMFEFIAREKLAGRIYKKEEFHEHAAPHWQNLPQDVRDVYNKRAKDKVASGAHKNKNSSPPKFTSHGVLISDMEKAAAALVGRQRNAKKRIEDLVYSSIFNNELELTKFNFIMANYFVKTTHGVYYPAELALIKFNFKDGIKNEYHQYLNPQTLPTGYAFEAVEHAKVHRMKVPPHAMGETRFEKVYDDLLKFLRNDQPTASGTSGKSEPVPVFIHDDHMNMIRSVLSQLPEIPESVETDIDVLSLNSLFNELKNVGVENTEHISIHVSNWLLNADRYDSAQNIACDYHEREDAAMQCAMSVCRRWYYTFCDHVCQPKLNVRLVAGVHLPQGFHTDSANDDKVKKSESFAVDKLHGRSVNANDERGASPLDSGHSHFRPIRHFDRSERQHVGRPSGSHRFDH